MNENVWRKKKREGKRHWKTGRKMINIKIFNSLNYYYMFNGPDGINITNLDTGCRCLVLASCIRRKKTIFLEHPARIRAGLNSYIHIELFNHRQGKEIKAPRNDPKITLYVRMFKCPCQIYEISLVRPFHHLTCLSLTTF